MAVRIFSYYCFVFLCFFLETLCCAWLAQFRPVDNEARSPAFEAVGAQHEPVLQHVESLLKNLPFFLLVLFFCVFFLVTLITLIFDKRSCVVT